ncbi:pimeloyl-ACP methyl ester carboxylesterase [Kribbella amoyensis]|uniref:Pimeloyl-ACP methyl ester carboxylesterase n=1 Tax=Kribbella amoyensis TaxID=996641 RepID=A0A561BUJ4_9ACTN|nr:alpha/beta hydrolase [Kribbella amoyensis]TWD82565.1 pimeloyl-ACP methyl ester carboxylesterase [Kribbella amoyensis]
MNSPERVIETNGIQLCTQTYGAPEDPAVLLVAGTSCSMDWWTPDFCTALAGRGFFVLRFDQRDTGRSSRDEPGNPTYSLTDLTRDAVGVLDGYSIDQAYWVGFSQGGWVSQLAALDHPDRVAALTLISTRPTGHGQADPDLPEVTAELLATWEQSGEPLWDDPAAMIDYLVESERSLAAAPFDEQAARAIGTSCVTRSADLRSAVINHPMADQGPRWRHRLEEIAVPTVVLHGDQDPLFPPANATALTAEIPGAVLQFLPVGHELPPRVHPTVIEAITGSALNSLTAGGGSREGSETDR